ncbi:unnamed protein product, partial [Owenia fusiformis]
ERSLGNESADMKTFMASDEDTAEQKSRGCALSPIEQPRHDRDKASPIEQPRHAVEQPTHLSDIVNSPIEEKVDNCTLLSPKKQRQFAYRDSFSPIEQCRRAQIQTDHYLPLIDNVEKLASPCKDVSLCGSLTLSPLVEPRLIKNSTLLDGGFAKQANDVTDFFELSSIEYNDVSDKDEDPTINEDIEEVSSSSDNADDADTEDSDDVDNPQDELVKIRAVAERSPVRHISTLDSRRPQKRRRLQKKMPIKCSTHLFPDVAPDTESHQSGITHGHSRAVAQCLGIRRVRTFTSTPINSPPSNNTSLDVSAVASPQCDSFELAINSTSEVNSEEIHVDS